MKTSIVLSTYNGEKYIFALLESLRNQSLKADEVLICDDCSTDSTVKIIRMFIEYYSLNSWFLFINKINIGWKKNFMNLIFNASGNLIFPCDQDDIWNEHKIKILHNLMVNFPDARLICSDYEILYMNGAVKFPSTKISRIKNNGQIEKIINPKALLAVDRPGCTYCINRNLIPLMKQQLFDECPHDALAWRTAALLDQLYVLHSPLITFRRHDNNASDNTKRSRLARISTAEYFIELMSRLEKCCIMYIDANNKKEYIQNTIQTQRRRIEYLEKRSFGKWLLCLIYIKNYPSLNTYVADGISILFCKE